MIIKINNNNNYKNDINCLFCNTIIPYLLKSNINNNNNNNNNRNEKLIKFNNDFILFEPKFKVGKIHYLVIPYKKHINHNIILNKNNNDNIKIFNNMYKFAKKSLSLDINIDNVDFIFHKPPFNTQNHLHLHVIYNYNNLYRKLLNKLWIIDLKYLLRE